MSDLHDSWDTFWNQICSIKAAIAKSKAINLNSVSTREDTRHLVQQYFRTTRPQLTSLGIDNEILSALDEPLQNLLRLANGRNRRDSYRKAIRAIDTCRTGLEIERERLLGGSDLQSRSASHVSRVEQQIITTIEQLVPSASLSYQQAVRDLRDTKRLSYRGVAVEIREALREVLDHLAPDQDVARSSGFKLEKDVKKPTMKQKARFILKSRGLSSTALSAPQDAVSRVEDSAASLARSVYTRGSLSTHMATSREEVLQLKMYADSILAELLQVHRAG